MKIIRFNENIKQNLRETVVAIGNFDGVHIAHQSLLTHAKNIANSMNKPFVVMSFNPHPKHYFLPNSPDFAIEKFSTRLRRLKDLGADGVVISRFNAKFANMEASQFINEILVRKLGAFHVVVGDDFRFGHNRVGSPETLRQSGIICTAFAPIKLHNQIVSSSMIRTQLTSGEMTQVQAMLGRPYEISGVVIHGDGRGKTLATPTLNIALHGLHLPRFGVYAVRLIIANKAYNAIANLGVRPTFYEAGKTIALLEIHALELLPQANLYGAKIIAQLLHFIRDEKKFECANALQNQIKNDINQVQQLMMGLSK